MPTQVTVRASSENCRECATVIDIPNPGVRCCKPDPVFIASDHQERTPLTILRLIQEAGFRAWIDGSAIVAVCKGPEELKTQE